MMVEPARFVVRAVAATGQRAYEYRFSYVAESLRKQWKGAPHATEIPFVFDTVAARYGKDLRPRTKLRPKPPWLTGWRLPRPAIPMAKAVRIGPVHTNEDQLMNFTNAGPVAEHDAWKARLDADRSVGAEQIVRR